jgi:hypothetical protein
MKIVFYELIRMIIGHEREKCEDPDLYDLARSVGKIDGYQELTNKMHRVFNERFLLNNDELNKKHQTSKHGICRSALAKITEDAD